MNMSGKGTLTKYGKRMLAASMYGKGKAFVGAYILVSRQEQSEPAQYVKLHLLCQGIEIILKGLLLFSDYDHHKNKLIKPLGHDLLKIVSAAHTAYSIGSLRPKLHTELSILNNFYKSHLLRYGGINDILIAPSSIEHKMVFARIAAVIRLTERHLRAHSNVI